MVKVRQGTSAEQTQRDLYKRIVTKAEGKPPRLRNAAWAFFAGGVVCLIGQAITDFWAWFMGVSTQQAGDPTVATMIFIGALLTGLGLFDNVAKRAGMGVGVPVTGFANSMVSSALEFKREGLVYGVGSRMFQLAGSIIVFGVMTAFVVGVVASLVDGFTYGFR
jgi:stage V sporulation protein AC